MEIDAENAKTLLLKGKFNFLPQKILKKTMLFDTSHINEKKPMNKISEALSVNNDEIYVLHGPGTTAFILKRDDGE